MCTSFEVVIQTIFTVFFDFKTNSGHKIQIERRFSGDLKI